MQDGQRVSYHAAVAVIKCDRGQAADRAAGAVPCEQLTE